MRSSWELYSAGVVLLHGARAISQNVNAKRQLPFFTCQALFTIYELLHVNFGRDSYKL
jgi:hypothetical protein